MSWVVYILFSKKLNRFYTGYSHQLDERLQQHAQHLYGNDAFTAKAADWVLQLQLSCRDEAQARAIEKHIKQMKSSTYIKNLIQYSELQQKLLSRY
jgi:putative endonuclease